MTFQYCDFLREHARIFSPKQAPTTEFLTWFVGFSEGDGSFMVTNRGDLMFVITQSLYNVDVLKKIEDHLGFGKVITQSKNTKSVRFIVQDQVGTYLLILLFNGNLVLPSRRKRFLSYLQAFNSQVQKSRTRKPIRSVPVVGALLSGPLPSLKNSWIAGITDSERCFYSGFSKSDNGYSCAYLLTQKGEENRAVLGHIQELFGIGAVREHSIKGNWTLDVSGYKKCQSILNYFHQFPLLSRKNRSFSLWKKIILAIGEKKHLIPSERAKLIVLSKQVNPKIDRDLLGALSPWGKGRPLQKKALRRLK